MAIYDDVFFLRQVSNRLKLFKQAGKNQFFFRCYYCGDSKTNEFKTRGTFYGAGDHLNYGCYNCGRSTTFSSFLKEFDPIVYKDYLRHKFHSDQVIELEEEIVSPEDLEFPSLFSLNKMFPVTASQKAVDYLKSRFVFKTKEIYFTSDASEVIEKYRPETRKVEGFKDREAIVFPLMTLDKAIIGCQMRFLEGDFRYMTIKFHEEFAKLYSIPDIDLEQDIWVTEGIFDALMLPNGLANLDGSLSQISAKTGLPKDKFILVHDNEPRNREIMKEMNRSVERGYRVYFWPQWASEYGKDLNEIRQKSPEAFEGLLESKEGQVLSGLRARLEMKKFQKF